MAKNGQEIAVAYLTGSGHSSAICGMSTFTGRRTQSALPRLLLIFVLLLSAASFARALGPLPVPTLESRVAQIENKISQASPINSGDNAWLLVSSALVLMMTAPGLILFYGGLVRRKNVLGTMMHSMVLMGLVSILWVLYGYSMAFGSGNAFCGDPRAHFLLSGVGAAPDPDYAPTVPAQSFMLFQMMFAIITPALISGAVAERMKFGAYLIFTGLWVTLVYFPLAHMVWGKGGFFNWASGGSVPVLDFAGGTVVHISSGFSALVCALVLGRRLGFPREPMPPHNVVLSLTGTGLLWVGWFGFNAGSALTAGGLATSAFAATHFSAAAAAMSWVLCERWHKGKPSVLGAASGMVAGLATITPAAGFVSVPSALLIGLMAGAVCYFAVTKLKSFFNYDDSLDVFGVHGVGSTVGMLMLGFLANPTVNDALATTWKVNGAAVSLGGGPAQFFNQLKGVVFTMAFAGIATFILLKLVSAFGGLRVSEEDETLGLDLTQHGESAYNE